MAQQTTCFRSDAGNDFAEEFDAWKDDLRHYIFGKVNNEKIARDLADAMCADLKPRYGKPTFTGAAPPIEFPGIAQMIFTLNRLHRETPPELDLRPGVVNRGAPVEVLTDISGQIAGVTRIGPVPNSVKVSHVEPEAPPYAPGAAL
jgi:hypothetical protein